MKDMLLSKKGDYVAYKNPYHGTATDQALCKKYLKLHDIYRVKSVEIRKFHSRICLENITNKDGISISFNTRNFINYES